MTKILLSNEKDQTYRQTCSCCGRRIRLLGDQQSLARYLEEKSLQRRGFQCINCGYMICRECHENGEMCICRSNAWLAKPYLDLSAVRAI